MKNHLCKFVLLGFVAINVTGCGGATNELPPAAKEQKIDPEKNKAEMQKAMERNGKKGLKLPNS